MPIGNPSNPFSQMLQSTQNAPFGNNGLNGLSSSSSIGPNPFSTWLRNIDDPIRLPNPIPQPDPAMIARIHDVITKLMAGNPFADIFRNYKNQPTGGTNVQRDNRGNVKPSHNTGSDYPLYKNAYWSPQDQANADRLEKEKAAGTFDHMQLTPEQLMQVRQQFLQQQPVAGSRTGVTTPAY